VSRDGRLKIADFGLARAFVPPIRPFTHEVCSLSRSRSLGYFSSPPLLPLTCIIPLFANLGLASLFFPSPSSRRS
jgi:hypothetical protein